jgi:two-component system sensor histidine kinase ResE
MNITVNVVLWATLFIMTVVGFLVIKNSRDQRNQNHKLEKLKDVLQKANERLIFLDSKKNEFLSFASHQLRTPLTSIKWGLDSLKETYSIETVNHLFATTNDLISTVNDLLDISKIEQGGMVMKKEEFDIYDFIGRIVEEFQMTAKNKGLKMTFHGKNEPCLIVADENKLRQVFVNLIDNAIKYTKAGVIDVKFEKNNKEVFIEIKDTGPGIDSKELSEIFLKFLRGAAGKESVGGSGLGLYLAKKIVEDHHGDILAYSKGLGKGSTFTVKLPLKS